MLSVNKMTPFRIGVHVRFVETQGIASLLVRSNCNSPFFKTWKNVILSNKKNPQLTK